MMPYFYLQPTAQLWKGNEWSYELFSVSIKTNFMICYRQYIEILLTAMLRETSRNTQWVGCGGASSSVSQSVSQSREGAGRFFGTFFTCLVVSLLRRCIPTFHSFTGRMCQQLTYWHTDRVFFAIDSTQNAFQLRFVAVKIRMICTTSQHITTAHNKHKQDC